MYIQNMGWISFWAISQIHLVTLLDSPMRFVSLQAFLSELWTLEVAAAPVDLDQQVDRQAHQADRQLGVIFRTREC
jgi:hypothetical protein